MRKEVGEPEEGGYDGIYLLKAAALLYAGVKCRDKEAKWREIEAKPKKEGGEDKGEDDEHDDDDGFDTGGYDPAYAAALGGGPYGALSAALLALSPPPPGAPHSIPPSVQAGVNALDYLLGGYALLPGHTTPPSTQTTAGSVTASANSAATANSNGSVNTNSAATPAVPTTTTSHGNDDNDDLPPLISADPDGDHDMSSDAHSCEAQAPPCSDAGSTTHQAPTLPGSWHNNDNTSTYPPPNGQNANFCNQQ